MEEKLGRVKIERENEGLLLPSIRFRGRDRNVGLGWVRLGYPG